MTLPCGCSQSSRACTHQTCRFVTLPPGFVEQLRCPSALLDATLLYLQVSPNNPVCILHCRDLNRSMVEPD